jgi:uncharacterized membrane protein YphA (DoxX/SURF4 family)
MGGSRPATAQAITRRQDEMRRTRTRQAGEPDRTDHATTDRSRRSWANGWPVLPLRLFLSALFCFAGYAKFSYPRFFDPTSPNGFKAAVDAARHGTPLGSVMGPLADHPSLFGHLTACAEIAIGLGLLVGLLTRLAALGGMVLTTMIVLSINWNGVKEYTGSSGWFTSVELALIAALSVFLLGGAGPLALDNLFIRARERQRARDDAEPSFRDSDLEDSRRRLQGEPVRGDSVRDEPMRGEPVRREPLGGEPVGGASVPGTGTATAQLPNAGYHAGRQDEEYRDDPEPESNSLWTQDRRGPEQHYQADERRPAEPSGPADR